MKATLFASTAIAALGFASVASAQFAETEVVKLTMTVNQPSMFDTSMRDTFTGRLDDDSGITALEAVCSAGASSFGGFVRSDEACAVTGSHTLKNPNNPAQTVLRANLVGGFTIVGDQDGYTPLNNIAVNYQTVGTLAGGKDTFSGHLIMMPENPSASASALGQALIANLKEKAGAGSTVEYDTQIDSVQFVDVVVPSIGHANSEACTWSGDWIYSYAAEAWQGAFDVTCGTERYRLEGSMPLVEAPAGSEHDEEYLVNLIMPGAGGGDAFAAPDPFATVEGVSGTLKMSNSGRSTEDGVYENVSINGELTGVGVPLEVVRGWGQIVVVLGRTFMGE